MLDARYVVELDGRADVETIGEMVTVGNVVGVSLDRLGYPFGDGTDEYVDCIHVGGHDQDGYYVHVDDVESITDLRHPEREVDIEEL